MELACLYIDGEKQTTDVAKGLRYQIGRRAARHFFQEEGIMDNKTFDMVAWEDVRSALESKPRMYQLWYGKQCSGYCGMGAMLLQWDKDAHTRFPNCEQEMETADHLNRCPSSSRRQLLADSIREIEEWMDGHCTHPELRRWVPQYIAYRGQRLFTELPGCGTMTHAM